MPNPIDWNAILTQVLLAFAGQYKIFIGLGLAYGMIMWIFAKAEQFLDDGGRSEALRKAELREWVAHEMDYRQAEREVRLMESQYEEEKKRQEFLNDLYAERQEKISTYYFDDDGNLQLDNDRPAAYLEDMEREEQHRIIDSLKYDESAGSLYDPKPVDLYQQKTDSVLHYESANSEADHYSLQTKHIDSNGMYDPFETGGDEWWSSDEREDDDE